MLPQLALSVALHIFCAVESARLTNRKHNYEEKAIEYAEASLYYISEPHDKISNINRASETFLKFREHDRQVEAETLQRLRWSIYSFLTSILIAVTAISSLKHKDHTSCIPLPSKSSSSPRSSPSSPSPPSFTLAPRKTSSN